MPGSQYEQGEKQATPLEVERKFTVHEIPKNLHEYEHARIRQGYIAIDSKGTEVRLRDKEGAYTLTVKSKGNLVRGEYETPISAEQFDVLWATTADKRVEKTRYAIPYEEHTIELDIYEGNLSGLVTAEVEFTSTMAAELFQAPDWFAEDVTNESSFKNQNLAQAGSPL